MFNWYLISKSLFWLYTNIKVCGMGTISNTNFYILQHFFIHELSLFKAPSHIPTVACERTKIKNTSFKSVNPHLAQLALTQRLLRWRSSHLTHHWPPWMCSMGGETWTPQNPLGPSTSSHSLKSHRHSIFLRESLASALYRKSNLCIPRKGIVLPQSQFLHSCVCERFIYSQDQSTYLAAAE